MSMSTEKIRVRFAPSPTGPLHIGGVRTALFNYLFARHLGGTMLLRIEDTDSKRYVPGAEEYIVEALHWLGIQIDEGVGATTGDCGPYRQSERKGIYLQYVQQLLASGHAYYAFDTVEELDVARQAYPNFIYDSHTRLQMRNSLTLPKAEVEQLLAAGEPYAVRFKIEPGEQVEFTDLIRGKITIDSTLLDDKVIYKQADGLPTYHMANVVDDHLMRITHVIRGEEWISSTPLHVLLYRALGWQDTMPQFAHLSLILKPVGSGKLSKRDGDKFGFPVYPLEWRDPDTNSLSLGYREQGYLPEAVVNFLALLGWNPGNDQEIFSMEELAKLFTLDCCSKSGARFDFEKAKWFNHEYILNVPITRLLSLVLPMLEMEGIEVDRGKLEAALAVARSKAQLLSELLPELRYFFVSPQEYDPVSTKKHWKSESPEYLQAMGRTLQALGNAPSQETIEQALYGAIKAQELPMGKVMNSMRIALVGTSRGVRIHEIIALIGVPETISRFQKAIEQLG